MEQMRLFPQTVSTDWKWELKDLDEVEKNGKKCFHVSHVVVEVPWDTS